MTGETLFRALCVTKDDVVTLAMGWTKADTARVVSALASGTYKLLPRPLRDLLDRLAGELDEREE